MSTISFILVVLVALVVGMASVLDERQFYRPLVACTLMGLVMGDLTTGVILGGALELIALGWMNVGTAMAPDAALASTVASVVVIAGHQDVNTGIAIAVPLAAAGQVLTIFVRTIAVFFQHQADRFAANANFRGIEIMHFSALSLQGLRVAIPTAAVAAVTGTDLVDRWLSAIPDVVATGLQVAGGFIVVVGYAMVINMMNARALMPFFFLGFIFATFATTVGGSASVSDHSKGIDKWVIDLAPNGATLVALGILGACLAVIYVQLNPEFHDSVRLPAAASPAASGGSSSDLDDDLDDELN